MFKVEPATHDSEGNFLQLGRVTLIDVMGDASVGKHLLCKEQGPGFRSSAVRKSSVASAQSTGTGQPEAGDA